MTRTRRNLLGTVVAVLAGCATVGGCTATTSGSLVGPSTGRSGTTSGAPSSSTASSAKVRSTPLQAADLPSGWTSTPHDATNDDQSGDVALRARLATCIGVTAPAEDTGTGEVHSPDFTSGESVITSNAAPADAAKSKLIKQIVASPKSDACVQQALVAQLAKTLPSGSGKPVVRAEVFGRGEGQPDNVVANLSAIIAVTVQGQAVSIYLPDVDLESSTVQTAIDFQGVGAPISASVSSGAINAVSERVART